MSLTADDQRVLALSTANHVRIGRRQLRERLRDGELTIEDVIADPPEVTSTMTIAELITFAPGVGAYRVNRALRRADVWPLRPVGKLTDYQRQRVACELVTFGRGSTRNETVGRS